MLASLLVVFREVLEAGLIIGIALAATVGVPGCGRWVAGGVAAGVLGACIVAAFARVISDALEGVGQEIFTASILFLAVLMLSWHCVWMSSHGRKMAVELKAAGSAVKGGDKSLFALAVVVTIAVLREGSEVVLFLYGIAATAHIDAASLLIGGAGGVALGAVFTYLMFRGLLTIPAKYLFDVTNGLIALLAASMAGQAVSVLASIDVLPTWGQKIWDTSNIVPEGTMVGRALKAMIGYSDRPIGIQVAAYIATLAALIALTWLVKHRPASSVSTKGTSR
jgi:high-affinity iron transporter